MGGGGGGQQSAEKTKKVSVKSPYSLFLCRKVAVEKNLPEQTKINKYCISTVRKFYFSFVLFQIAAKICARKENTFRQSFIYDHAIYSPPKKTVVF